jgi:hypothetical protein
VSYGSPNYGFLVRLSVLTFSVKMVMVEFLTCTGMSGSANRSANSVMSETGYFISSAEFE